MNLLVFLLISLPQPFVKIDALPLTALIALYIVAFSIYLSSYFYPVFSTSVMSIRKNVVLISSVLLISLILLFVFQVITISANPVHFFLFSVPFIFASISFSLVIQNDIRKRLIEVCKERREPVIEEIEREKLFVQKKDESLLELQKQFNTMIKRFDFVRSFGSSLRFEVAWQDIERGAKELLGTHPVVFFPRLPGSLPNGFYPFIENNNELFARQEWAGAMSGVKIEKEENHQRLCWIPLGLGDGQRAIVYLRVDKTIPEEAVDIYSNQMNLLIEKMRLYNEVELQSRTDLMTGLSHHAAFKAILNEEVERSKITENPISLLIIDVDHFKQVNDTYGHLVGDQVLINIASKIKSTVRISDSVARYGGEEFAVILPETPLDGAREIAERIRTNVESMVIIVKTETDEKKLSKTISIGLASSPPTKRTAVDLCQSADSALYKAKRSGRNQVTF